MIDDIVEKINIFNIGGTKKLIWYKKDLFSFLSLW